MDGLTDTILMIVGFLVVVLALRRFNSGDHDQRPAHDESSIPRGTTLTDL